MATYIPRELADDDYYSPPPKTAESKQPSSGTSTTGSTDWPGRRLYNPLGKFASYTYQLSLYVITPDAYDAFIQSGRTRINALREGAPDAGGGAFIVAQSGGINPTTDARAPGFDLDYYIDNLSYKTIVEGPGGLNSYEFKFDIIEPYGFSFITKLAQLVTNIESSYANSVYAMSKALKQFYVLGIRFNGYDIEGNVYSGKNSLTGSADLDSAATSSGLFETYYDIMITDLKFKLDGKQTIYNISAAPYALHNAFSFKRGLLDEGARVSGGTVGELVGELVKQKTSRQQQLSDQGVVQEANTYTIVWEGEGVEKIRDAKIVTGNDTDKSKLPDAGVEATIQSSEVASTKATPNVNAREFIFRNGTTILDAIKTIIANSSYAEDALKAVYNSNQPYKDNDQTTDGSAPGSQPDIRWYNIGSKVTGARWDNTRGDWAYDITYIIRPYDTPSIQTAYAGSGSAYPGPHKRYRYWLTGENSEIIAYEQVFNNLYFLAMHRPEEGDDQASKQGGAVPVSETKRTDLSRPYKLNTGSEAINSYLTSLQDESSWVTAKFTILGDPDYLMSDSLAGTSSEVSKYYGYNGFSINPNGGQIFIEIDFKEGVDYNNNNGLFTINENIIFWKYPPSIASRVKGVIYRVITVISSFQGGKFLQTIEANVATFPDTTDAVDSDARKDETAESTTISNTPSGTGLKKDNPPAQTPVSTSGNPQTRVNLNNRGTDVIDY